MHNQPYSIRITRTKLSFIVFWLTCTISLSSCFDEEFVPATTMDIDVSTDTLRFDTVFTTIGSTTLNFTINNRSDQNVIVDQIFLDAPNTMFRLNVDGISTNNAQNVKILANDSIYVFVEVTVNPDQDVSVSPFIIEEFLNIRSGSSTKRVLLEAWGQNANYITGKDARGRFLRFSCNNGQIIWDDPKPYIINGVVFIDSCTIVVPAGARVYTHGGQFISNNSLLNDGALIFLPTAQLQVNGTESNPVIFQADRLEQEYQSEPGQWSGIRFLAGQSVHSLNNVIIKNSIVGIRADSATSVSLRNVQIYNTSSIGLVGINANIQMDNCLIYANEAQSCVFASGGSYRLRHCTLANFQNRSPALYMDNFSCLDEDCINRLALPLDVVVENSIIVGSNDDEIEVVDVTGGQDEFLSLSFQRTLLKIQESKVAIDFNANCSNCLEWGNEQLFLDPDNYNYALDTLSVARDKGILISDLRTDILGTNRDANPDLGCLEFIK